MVFANEYWIVTSTNNFDYIYYVLIIKFPIICSIGSNSGKRNIFFFFDKEGESGRGW